MKTHVHESFNRLRKALDVRQKLLLRQIDVVFSTQNHQNAHHQHHLQLMQQQRHTLNNGSDESNQQTSPMFNANNINNIEFINENELDVLNSIRKYGRYNFEHYNIVLNDMMIFQNQNEDDHHHNDYDLLMHKSCITADDDTVVTKAIEQLPDNTNIIKENADYMNESIIHITLNETKELIDQTTNKTKLPLQPPTNVNENATIGINTNTTNYNNDIIYTNAIRTTRINNFDKMKIDLTNIYDDDIDANDRNNSLMHISKSSQTELLNRSNTLRNISNLTLNNNNGTINLKNVSNVIITNNNNRLPKNETDYVDSRKIMINEGESNHEITKRTDHSYSSKTIQLSSALHETTIDNTTGVEAREYETPEIAEPDEEAECMFYKRLISENKILKNHIIRANLIANHMVSDSSTVINPYSNPDHYNQKIINLPLRLNTVASSSNTSNNNCSNSNISTSASGIKSVLNSNIPITDADGGAGTSTDSLSTDAAIAGKSDDIEQQQQVQQWLKQIIYETEIEPLQQSNILEFTNEVNG